jgi:hypothetical protein
MNLKDRFAEWLLAAFDRLMDTVTFDAWTRVRGDVRWTNIKVRK